MRTVSRIDEVQANQPPREMSNRELWRWRVRHSPDSNYLRIDGRAWTYAELDDDVRRLAGGLRELGVGPGSRALVGMSNRAETVVAHLALAQLQTVIVPEAGHFVHQEQPEIVNRHLLEFLAPLR